MYIVYKITNTYDNKIYVGMTSKTLKERLNNHFSSDNCPFHKDYLKLNKNKDYFIIEEIESFEDKKIAEERETYWVRELKANVYGYNKTSDGKLNPEATTNQTWNYTTKYIEKLLEEFTPKEKGRLFDLLIKIGKHQKIYYNTKNISNYIKDYKGLAKLYETSFDSLRKSLIPKCKKYDIIRIIEKPYHRSYLTINPHLNCDYWNYTEEYKELWKDVINSKEFKDCQIENANIFISQVLELTDDNFRVRYPETNNYIHSLEDLASLFRNNNLHLIFNGDIFQYVYENNERYIQLREDIKITL